MSQMTMEQLEAQVQATKEHNQKRVDESRAELTKLIMETPEVFFRALEEYFNHAVSEASSRATRESKDIISDHRHDAHNGGVMVPLNPRNIRGYTSEMAVGLTRKTGGVDPNDTIGAIRHLVHEIEGGKNSIIAVEEGAKNQEALIRTLRHLNAIHGEEQQCENSQEG